MSLRATGSITMKSVDCLKCDASIRVGAAADHIVCENCGASYKVVNRKLDVSEVIYDYDFNGFLCLNHSSYRPCFNACPAPYMFCEEHSDDKHIQDKQRDIQAAQKRLEEHKDLLNKIYESKKVWLTRKLSGLDVGEDDAISENTDG